jgi:hypothetical protein
MSVLTTDLAQALNRDLCYVLDAYQLSECKEIWPDATPRQAAAWFLRQSLLKKYCEGDEPGLEAQTAALTKWHECNDVNRSFEVVEKHLHEVELVNAVRDEMYNFWYGGDDRSTPLWSSFNQLFDYGAAGKGASVKAAGTDLYTKF